jgi:hypothetical protein
MTGVELTEKVVVKPELDALTMRFKEVETKFGADFHSRYEEIVEKLEESFDINGKGGV